MSRTNEELKNISLLGNQNTKYKYDHPSTETLETFVNKHPEVIYLVEFKCPEFTSLCVAGNTMIDICCDESKNPQGIAIRDLVGTEGYLYSFDITSKTTVVKKYYNVRKTQENVNIVSIKLLEKRFRKKIISEIKVTPNHLILVKNGFKSFEWIQAKDLIPGMQVVSNQHEYGSDNIRDKSRHRILAEALFGSIDGYNIHHKDGNHYNNTPNNIELLTTSKHNSHHQSIRYKYDAKINDDILIQQYLSGLNKDQLAKMYKCDGSTIATRLERNNIKLRTQSESLIMKRSDEFYQIRQECRNLYEQGFTCVELADYFRVDSTTVLDWIRWGGGKVRTSNETRQLRKSIQLPSLNHRILSIESAGIEDVYNMEVEDTECFFGNGIVIHNCPRTGQPDFATMYIRYVPDIQMVESKSLKLYLFSFRNHGDFHEDCTNVICKDLTTVMQPKWIRVIGDFVPRGGISISTIAEYKRDDFTVPEHFLSLPKDLHTRHM